LGSGFDESCEAFLKDKPHLYLDEDETARFSFRRDRRDSSSLRPRSDHVLRDGKAVTELTFEILAASPSEVRVPGRLVRPAGSL
jgi:hypothetical protein